MKLSEKRTADIITAVIKTARTDSNLKKKWFSIPPQTPCCVCAVLTLGCAYFLEPACRAPKVSISHQLDSSSVCPAAAASTQSKDTHCANTFTSNGIGYSISLVKFLCISTLLYSFTGSPLCNPCPPGSFNNNTGGDSCTSCSPGVFIQP